MEGSTLVSPAPSGSPVEVSFIPMLCLDANLTFGLGVFQLHHAPSLLGVGGGLGTGDPPKINERIWSIFPCCGRSPSSLCPSWSRAFPQNCPPEAAH